MNTLQRSWLTWLCLCCACNGVGRGLVNDEVRGGSESQLCKEMLCESKLPALRVPQAPGEFGDLAHCANHPPITARSLPLAGCDCENYELPALDTNTVPIQLAGMGLFTKCRLRISSDRPVELQLVKTSLQDVHLELNGPIALKLREAQLVRVSIDARNNAAGAPSLAFEDSNASVLMLHAGEGGPISALEVSQSTLIDALLEADSIHLISVLVQRCALSARNLDTSDANFIESSLDIDRGLLSASDLNNVSMRNCGQAGFAGSKLSTCEVSCGRLLQLYSTKTESSLLEGALVLDDAEISNTIFGVSLPTSVLSYSSIFSAVTFCEQTQSARLSRGSANCAACQGPLLSGEGQLCSDGTFSVENNENPCAAFEGLPYCDLPPSKRPH